MSHTPFNKSRFNNLSKDSIVQVKHDSLSGVKQVISQGDLEDAEITGLAIAFTPKFADSKILITAMVNHAIIWTHSFGILRDSNLLAQGSHGIEQGAAYNASGNAGTQAFSTGGGAIICCFIKDDSTSNNDRTGVSNFEYLDDADSTTARTYKICCNSSFANTAQNMIIGDRNSNGFSGLCSMTIYEIKQ